MVINVILETDIIVHTNIHVKCLRTVKKSSNKPDDNRIKMKTKRKKTVMTNDVT